MLICPRLSTPKDSTNAAASPFLHSPGAMRRASCESLVPRIVSSRMAKSKRAPRTGPGRRRPRKGGLTSGRELAGTIWLYGQHPVQAALRNPLRRRGRLLATREGATRLCRDSAAPLPEIVDRATLERLLPHGAVHQGLALEVAPLAPLPLESILDHDDPAALILVLDQVTDPHNVGAVLRNAAAFGACAIVVQTRHAPPESGVLAKAASGALETVPLVRCVNLARALARMKAAGFWCVGLTAEATTGIAEIAVNGRIALILGAEGRGLRRLTEAQCDLTAAIPTRPSFPALNVASAAAVALYELRRRSARASRQDKGRARTKT